MAKSVTLWGATYSNVPAIVVPSGNSTAKFIEPSPTTATASDVASGKIFFDSQGNQQTGSASGGGGTGAVWQDQQGYINLDDEAGGSITVESLSVTTNGTYTAPTGKAYSPVTVNVSGGGDSWSWMGKNPTLVQTVTPSHVLFKDSGLASWTWSTSEMTLKSNEDVYVSAGSEYDYVFVFRYYAHYDYGNWTPMSAMKESAGVYVQSFCREASNYTNMQAGTLNQGVGAQDFATYPAYYYNSTGTLTGTTEGKYGLYYANGTVSASSSSVYFKIPRLNARGSTSSFSQTALANLDMESSYIDYTAEVWRVDAGTTWRGWSRVEVLNVLNNGL